MKKHFAKIISLALAVMMSLFVFTGCGLITINAERDMAQEIATVSIDEAFSDKIYKRELVSAYSSEGYYYVQYQGMDVVEVYENLLEDIVRNRVLVQQARIALTGKSNLNEVGYFKLAVDTLADETKENSTLDNVLAGKNYEGTPFVNITKTDSLDKFLTEYEYYNLMYSLYNSIRTFIDAYKDTEEEEHHHDAYEAFQGTVRTTLPAKSTSSYNEWELKNDEEGKVVDTESSTYKKLEKINKDSELGLDLASFETNYDLQLAVYKTYCEKFTISKEDKSAIKKIIRDLKKSGFVSSSEAAKATPSTIKELVALTYFNDALTVQLENAVINKYTGALINENEKDLAGDEDLYNAYKNLYNTQEALYTSSYDSYESALSSASDTSLVLCNPEIVKGEKYGYVLNLLIGFDEVQSNMYAEIEANGKLTATQRYNARATLLKGLVAKDLRSSWVESNYGDYDAETGIVTFKKDYCKTPALSQFNGNVYGAKDYIYHDSYDNEVTGYTYKSVKANEIAFIDFYNDIVAENMGFTKELNVDKLDGLNGQIDYSDAMFDIFKDIVMAYSTDDGSLEEGYGYVYSPKTSATTYVPEFAKAAKNVVNMGAGAYEICATKYGYHIILCTKVVEPTTACLTYDEFKAQLLVKDSTPYLFKEYQKDVLVSDNVSKKTDTFFKNILNNESSVKYYKDNYKDLLEA